jgi:sugar O-acyltransferase (sialic acid O-acetyltransferase NeuD family)
MVLIGYSGHAFVVYGIFKSAGTQVTAYCDATEKKYNPYNLAYIGSEDDAIAALKNGFFISIGDNNIRRKVYNKLAAQNLLPAIAIHKNATIDESADVAVPGIMIAASATINPLVQIGKGVICNTSCSIDHECIIGDFAHIAPGAVLCGNVKVGENSFIGAGAVIKEGVTVGSNVMIGAGAVVIKNVPDNVKMVGNPVRLIAAK